MKGEPRNTAHLKKAQRLDAILVAELRRETRCQTHSYLGLMANNKDFGSERDVPTWNGIEDGWNIYIEECEWFFWATPPKDRHLVASKLARRLTGSARTAIRGLRPRDFAGTQGIPQGHKVFPNCSVSYRAESETYRSQTLQTSLTSSSSASSERLGKA